MDNSELEEIRRRKLMEMQSSEESEEAKAYMEEQEAKKNTLLKIILSQEARERLNNLKLIRPQIAESLVNQLISIYQMGRIRVPISDEEFKNIIANVMPKRKEINIERRHYE